MRRCHVNIVVKKKGGKKYIYHVGFRRVLHTRRRETNKKETLQKKKYRETEREREKHRAENRAKLIARSRTAATAGMPERSALKARSEVPSAVGGLILSRPLCRIRRTLIASRQSESAPSVCSFAHSLARSRFRGVSQRRFSASRRNYLSFSLFLEVYYT